MGSAQRVSIRGDQHDGRTMKAASAPTSSFECIDTCTGHINDIDVPYRDANDVDSLVLLPKRKATFCFWSSALDSCKRRWFSGKISRCQRDAPGSIPGRRILLPRAGPTVFSF